MASTDLDAEIVRRARRLGALDHLPDGAPRAAPEQKRIHTAELARCAADVHHWIRSYVWIEDPKREIPADRVIPLVLWPAQVDLVDFLRSGLKAGENRILNKAREIGATWVALAIIYHLWLFEPRFSALLLSRKEKLVDDHTTDSLFGKLRFIHRHLPIWMRPNLQPREHDKYLHLTHPSNGSVIRGEATSGSAGRSGRQSVVLADEWSHVDRGKQQPLKLSMESVARTWWRISTPNGRGDDFHTAWLTAPDSQKLQLDWTTDPRRDRAWFQDLLKENGGELTRDERSQEHECSFAAVSGLRIWNLDRGRHTYREEDLTQTERNGLTVLAMDFGSGPSWSVGLALVVTWPEGKQQRPVLYLDREWIFERVDAGEIARDIAGVMAVRYPGPRWVVGDPAGIAKDAGQESWESRLRSGGLPMRCLPSLYNERSTIDATLMEVQEMLDENFLKINADRCPITLNAMESWEWNLPKGVPLELVSRASLDPRKDAWSHPGDALRYAVGAILRMDTGQLDEVADALEGLPMTEAGELGGLYDRLLGAGF